MYDRASDANGGLQKEIWGLVMIGMGAVEQQFKASGQKGGCCCPGLEVWPWMLRG